MAYSKTQAFRLGLVLEAVRGAQPGQEARFVAPAKVPPKLALQLIHAPGWSNTGLEAGESLARGDVEGLQNALEASLVALRTSVESLPEPPFRALSPGAQMLRRLAVALFPDEDAPASPRGAAGLDPRVEKVDAALAATMRGAAARFGNHSVGMARAYAMLVRCEDRCGKAWPGLDAGRHVAANPRVHHETPSPAPTPKPESLILTYAAERVFAFGKRTFPTARLWDRVEGIPESALEVHVDPTEWRGTEDVVRRSAYVEALEKAQGKHIFNGLNARLRDWSPPPPDGKLRMEFQPVRYGLFLGTNARADEPAPDGTTPRERYEPGPSLAPLREARMANELGMNALIETSDGKVIGVRRGGKGVGTENAVGPSVSGGLRWGSISEAGGSPFRGIREEMERELGITSLDVADLRMVSLARGLLWAGHPRVQFLARIRLSVADLEENLRRGTEESYEIARRDGRAISAWDAADVGRLAELAQRPDVTAPLAQLLAYHVLRQRGLAGEAP